MFTVVLSLTAMADEEDFFINYKGSQIAVSPVINGGNIYFIVHFKPPVIVAEGMVNESWLWYEVNKGETTLATEIGEILDGMDN